MSILMYHPTIKGETSDKNYKGWIDILKVKFGTNRKITSSTSTQGDRESSNASMSTLKIVKLMDKATPYIFIESCCGTGKTLKIIMTKTGSGQGADVFVEYTFENAMFARMLTLHNGLRPIEEIEISYTRMTTKYIPYDEDGRATGPLVVGFDATTNTKI